MTVNLRSHQGTTVLPHSGRCLPSNSCHYSVLGFSGTLGGWSVRGGMAHGAEARVVYCMAQGAEARVVYCRNPEKNDGA